MLPRFSALEFQRHLSGDLQQLLDNCDLGAQVPVQRGIVCSLRYLACVLRREVEQQDATEDFFPCFRLDAGDPGTQLDMVGQLDVPRRRACRHTCVSLGSKANNVWHRSDPSMEALGNERRAAS
jgi:hypothetical protein